MNFDQINKWAMLAANAGVAFGIFLLAFELNQNSRVTEAQIYQARAQSALQYRLALMESEKLLPLIVKIGAGPTAAAEYETVQKLEFEEQLRFGSFQGAIISMMDNLHYQYEQGFLEEEYYESVILSGARSSCKLWTNMGIINVARPSFRDLVKSLCAVEPQSG